jgi:hypothetical protein
MMIKIEELRIGNILKHTDGSIIIVDGIENATKEHHGCWLVWLKDEGMAYDIARLQPIPLSPDWLERCGFDIDYDRNEESYYSIGWQEGTRLRGIEIVSDHDGFRLAINDNEYVLGKCFHYVHQLQNLYFALIGEELPIKL